MLHAAAVLADEAGVRGVTLAALAARLGVRSPSLYAHVAGLDDVHRELTLRGASRLGATLEGAVHGAAGLAALRSLAAAYRAFAQQHPGLYEAAQQARLGAADTAVAAALKAAVEPALRALASAGVADGELIHQARSIRSALHGFVVLEHGGGFGLPESLDESYDRLVTLLLAGVDAAARRER